MIKQMIIPMGLLAPREKPIPTMENAANMAKKRKFHLMPFTLFALLTHQFYKKMIGLATIVV